MADCKMTINHPKKGKNKTKKRPSVGGMNPLLICGVALLLISEFILRRKFVSRGAAALKCKTLYVGGTSLVAQWLRIRLMQGTRVQSLVREDPTCCGASKPVRHNY